LGSLIGSHIGSHLALTVKSSVATTSSVFKMILMLQSEMLHHFETLQAMHRQEMSAYIKGDFLQLVDRMADDNIDITCRGKLCEWLCQIVDLCGYSRETVEISMSHLDRFVVTPTGTAALHDRTTYHLAAMACLYTTVKVHEREALSPNDVSRLSRGAYSAAQIESMESTVLAALNWHVNPPTALSFVREFVSILSFSHLSQASKAQLLELASAQTEYAVSCADFLHVPASTVAYCAFLNALKATLALNTGTIQYIGCIVAQVLHLDTSSTHVDTVSRHLSIYSCKDSSVCSSSPTNQQHTHQAQHTAVNVGNAHSSILCV
jgi:Cyclin, N-terminal domain